MDQRYSRFRDSQALVLLSWRELHLGFAYTDQFPEIEAP